MDSRLPEELIEQHPYPKCEGCGRHDTRLVEGYCEWCKKKFNVQLSMQKVIDKWRG